jgi:hypothetical protein
MTDAALPRTGEAGLSSLNLDWAGAIEAMSRERISGVRAFSLFMIGKPYRQFAYPNLGR